MDLILKHIPARHWWKRTNYMLVEPLIIAGWTVPKGFVTDGASVPFFLWWLFNPMGRHAPAAVLHDWLLQLDGNTRRLADNNFLHAMRATGVIGWRRWSMWAAVRLWGGCGVLWQWLRRCWRRCWSQ